MFGALLKRAQVTVDNAIGLALNRLLIATPFVLALGFATSGLYVRFERTYGAEISLYILAAGFAFFGLVAALAFHQPPHSEAATAQDTSSPAQGEEDASAAAANEALAPADRELMLAALTSTVPIALPAVLRGLMRNLPLVAVILAAAFILLASPVEEASEPGASAEAS